jgi:two-component system NtrC family sensor kinase
MEQTCRDVDEILGDTIHGVSEISDLVVNLKNFSRLDQAKITEVSLNECLDSALVVGKNALKYKATILKEYGEIPRVPCSPSQINQVFLNLLTNAVQAIEGSGRILLKTWFDDDLVYVSVQDTGQGIPKENLRRIFDPFFTTKEIGQGTGLGLSICYQIVRQHGGDIRVASEVGRGTRFVVSLPRRVAALKQAV